MKNGWISQIIQLIRIQTAEKMAKLFHTYHERIRN